MTNNEILQADMLDILFEHRNKMYGAYALRRDYNHRLGIALAISLSVVLLFMLSSFMKKKDNKDSHFALTRDSVIVRTYEIQKERQEEKAKFKKQVQQIQSTNRIVISIEETNVKPQEEIAVANVGNENVKGDLPEDPNKNISTVPVPENNSDDKQKESKRDFLPRETAASFPGGEAAWLSFLKRYLQTPEELEAGQRVNVLVRFMIDIDGNVSGIEIIKSGGAAFDKEVLRVINKMPKWEPGIQNGHPVAVWFTIPVIFETPEQ